ncbi:MAG: aminoacetone oxidase family FAD-binding enzyme [bacterium]|nr:aminoacetone oxidase family FAD-binding enzyme [bacterium]
MRKTNEIYDVIVIGGGASGMMAAGRAGERGRRVLLLEKNRNLGEKLKITGGGRCNITNAEENERVLLSHYGKAEPFLYSPFSQFGMKDTFSFFESQNLPLVVQERKRAFPKTEKAEDVFKALEKYLRKGNVEILSDMKVGGMAGSGGAIKKIIANGQEFSASSYILATGGISHPETGSTGDGFSWLKKLSHKVQSPTPTIVPLAVSDQWIKSLAGVSLPMMKITFFLNNEKKFSLKGPVLFTHFGLSGPLILNSAGKVSDLLHEGAVTALIDAYPDADLGSLDKQITKVFDANKNKMPKNIFNEITPKGTASAILSLLKNFNSNIKVNSVTQKQRKEIVNLLKALPVNISGLMGYDRAVISDGGLALAEVDTKTMRSKLYKNLYITGDLLHISRPSGGYSLQLCWTTGYVAGSHA